MKKITQQIASFKDKLLYQESGPLTDRLKRAPGPFGLGQVLLRSKPEATTSAVCGYCSTGCGLRVHLKNGEAVSLTPATSYPVNLGMACPKGWEALTPLDAPDRGVIPLLKSKDGAREAIPWEDALKTMCSEFQAIQKKHGKSSVAFISTGQIPTEEMALLGALTKFGMGMVHGDGNTRQCMASAVVAYKESFGFDAPPYTYQDFEESDVIVLVGSNLCIAHPIMWERICRNPHEPQIVVIDPRKTETATAATHHFAIRPKSDLVFFYALANILIGEGWVDEDFVQQHTRGYLEFSNFVQDYTPELACAVSGIAVDDLKELARKIHLGKRVSFWWTMGVNQSHEGVRVAQAIINLALLTGNLGRVGTGANSITGQCNAMGSRLFSNTTNLLGGHLFENQSHRNKVAEVLGLDQTQIPETVGWSYDKIIEGVLSGDVKGLWIIATNPAHSWINRGHIKEMLGRLDFLVVQDMYHSTETAQVADLYLPAAGWGEKEGTFINSERRIGLLKKVKRAPGQALADFHIFKAVAQYWGCGDMFDEWSSPEAVFKILQRLSAGMPCDFSGIPSYQAIDEQGGIQWPCLPGELPEGPTQRRLFEDGKFYHLDSKARFVFEKPRSVEEPIDDRFSFVLLTGRGSSSQWHTQTRTSKSAILRKMSPKMAYAQIHPDDAKQMGVRSGQYLRIKSRRGSICVHAFVTASVQRGQVFMPMHYQETNKLTQASFDPYSKQPSYKFCAVDVRRAEHWEIQGDDDEG
ncbi:MAG: nitrate reductase [Deltaproteobacteria bacterium]|nr:nitrate reductase [Deltaproteobacteria bacterium]MBT6434223.1 nitrate reductase [Deltaproteobacteria bacterium]MBT6490241.1 nitrate reductase [Deltaproteobacteria bacterium]